MREDAFRMNASMTSHSLQLVAEEFRKICKPKIQKLKGRYSAIAMLVFNSWLKDIKLCVRERKLTNMEVIQLIKDYTAEGARGAVEFYLVTNSTWKYHELLSTLEPLLNLVKLLAHWSGISIATYNDLGKQKISLLMSSKF